MTEEMMNQVFAVLADLRYQVGLLHRRVAELERPHRGEPCQCPLKQTLICPSSYAAWPPPPQLEPCWRPLADAAEILGYSQAALLEQIKQENGGGVIWSTCRDGQLFVDVDDAPLLRVVRKKDGPAR